MKPPGSRADADIVGMLSIETWVAVSCVSAFGLLGFLHTLACLVRNDEQLRTLAARVGELQAQRLERMKELSQSATHVMDIQLAGVNAPGGGSAEGAAKSSEPKHGKK